MNSPTHSLTHTLKSQKGIGSWNTNSLYTSPCWKGMRKQICSLFLFNNLISITLKACCCCLGVSSCITGHFHWYHRSQLDIQVPLSLCYRLSTMHRAHQQTRFPTLDMTLRTAIDLWKSHHSSEQGGEQDMQTLVVGAGWVLRFQIFHPKFPLPLVETRRLCGLPDCPELLHLQSHACEQRRTCKTVPSDESVFQLWILFGSIKRIVEAAWYRSQEKLEASEYLLRDI